MSAKVYTEDEQEWALKEFESFGSVIDVIRKFGGIQVEPHCISGMNVRRLVV